MKKFARVLWLPFVALCLAPPLFGAVGNGGAGTNGNTSCYVDAYNANAFAIGNGGYEPYQPNYENVAVPSVASIDTNRAPNSEIGGWATSVSPVDPCYSLTTALTYSVTNTATASPYYPQLALIDQATGAVTKKQIASDNVAISNQGHDMPALFFDLPGSCGGIAYGAESTFGAIAGGPAPSTWQVTSWGATTGYAEPFKKGCDLAGGATDFSNAANEYFMPSSGISEFTVATKFLGVGGVELACGQTQVNTNITRTGNNGCLEMDITSPTDVSFSVLCNGSIVQKIDTFAATGAAWNNCDGASHSANGVMQSPESPAGSDYYDFTVTAAPTSSGNMTVSCPTTGTATVAVLSTDTTATVANKIAAQMTTSCSSNYKYLQGNGTTCGSSCVGIEYTSAVAYSSLTTPVANGCTGVGVTCSANSNIWTTTGYAHFLWGGPTFIEGLYGGVWLRFLDVQDQTTNFRHAFNNNNALTFALMISPGPINGVWTWYDISMKNGSTDSPGVSAVGVPWLGMGPGGSCSAGSDCSEPGLPTIGTNGYCVTNCVEVAGKSPYVQQPPPSYAANATPLCYDWGSEAQNTCTNGNQIIPILSQEVITYWRGKLYVAFPQGCAGSCSVSKPPDGIAVWEINPLSKQVTNNWFFTISTSTSSPFYVTSLQFIDAADMSHIALYFATEDSAQTVNCTSGSGTCIEKLSFDGTTWTGPTLKNILGGTNGLATPCQFNTDPLRLILSADCQVGTGSTTGFYQFRE